MRINSTSLVIAASTLALITLLAFQVKWLTDSQKSIEEQFDEKVRLALCFAVSNTVVEPLSCDTSPQGCVSTSPDSGCLPLIQEVDGFKLESSIPFEQASLDSALEMAFAFYEIDLDYDMSIFENDSFNSFGVFPTYQCALNPLEKNDKHIMSITFPDKQKFIFSKMKFMFFSSIIILFFITTVFIFANYTMLRQKRLVQINTEFFNNMAHEFRTPLTNITLAGNLLSKKLNDNSHQRYIQVVHDESKKLQDQIERVLHLAKLENGEYQLEKEILNPNALMQDVIEGMDIQIKEKKAKIHFQSKNKNIALQGDRFHLSNAFRNLLDNALKYSCSDPEINIMIEQKQKGVMIQFEDNGVGICKKDQKGVFEKYQRVHQGDVHNQKGFGLGLAYVKMIIERHKGFIKVISDLNKGTRFDLFLPNNS